MAKRSLLLIGFMLALGAETAFFSSQFAAGILHVMGERSFFANRLARAWSCYRRALALGASRERLETDAVEVLLAALDQWEAGVRVKLPIPPAEAVPATQSLVADLILRAPFRAYSWSLASDAYLHAARQRRRETPIDLATLSENPEDNLMPEDWLGIAALDMAIRLEPNNYVYADTLVETLLQFGLSERAARACRLAVAANPELSAHLYLTHEDLSPGMLEAAAQGLQDARSSDSMFSAAEIDASLGKLFAEHGQDQRAQPYLQRAVDAAPELYEAQFLLGLVEYRAQNYRRAIAHLERVAALLPEGPWANYYMGLSYSALGMADQAASEFKEARERDPGTITFFHALGETLESQGKVSEAQRQFMAAANLHPTEQAAWLSLLAFYVRHKDRKGSAEVCTKLSALGQTADVVKAQCSLLDEGAP